MVGLDAEHLLDLVRVAVGSAAGRSILFRAATISQVVLERR